jgi:hypothetical protein
MSPLRKHQGRLRLTQLRNASVWLALGGTACAAGRAAHPVVVPAEIAQAIPKNARAVKVYSDQSPADYYRTVYRSLRVASLFSSGMRIRAAASSRQSTGVSIST